MVARRLENLVEEIDDWSLSAAICEGNPKAWRAKGIGLLLQAIGQFLRKTLDQQIEFRLDLADLVLGLVLCLERGAPHEPSALLAETAEILHEAR